MDIGKFTILGELGTGAASRVYKVRRTEDAKIYALKIVAVETAEDRKYVDQVQHEYDVASALDHPNLLKVHGVEIQRKLLFVSGARLLMEYVDGMPLADCKGLPLTKLLSILFKVADGLAYMHAEGYYHADMKPDNVLVGRQKEVKVIDFGLAWKRGEDKDRVQGTLEFLAPEQAKNKIVNGKTDIFNFGATMYRTLTGRAVPPELRQYGGDGEAVPLDSYVPPLSRLKSSIPSDLDELVRQCIRCNPEHRPATMRIVRDQIREIGLRLKKSTRGSKGAGETKGGGGEGERG